MEKKAIVGSDRRAIGDRIGTVDLRQRAVGIEAIECTRGPVASDGHRPGPYPAPRVRFRIVQPVAGVARIDRNDRLAHIGIEIDANDVAADPRHETTRLALYDPRGIMRLFETFDPPIRERHAVDPPAQYVDPEERVRSEEHT